MSLYQYTYIRKNCSGNKESAKLIGYYWDNKGLGSDGSKNNVKKAIIKKNQQCDILEISEIDTIE